MIRFVPALPSHAKVIAAHMRARDVAELEDGWGAAPEEVILAGLEASYFARIVFYEFEPLAIFGLVPLTLLTSYAQVWVVGTRFIDARSIAFARASRWAVSELFEHCTLMTNIIDSTDVRANKWMRWLGGEPMNIMHIRGGRHFSQFVLAKARRQCQQA